MKNYSVITKFAIILFLIGILIVVINWRFGIINAHITDGVSIVILCSLLAGLFANVSIAESKKKK
jgi:hypothetical protein